MGSASSVWEGYRLEAAELAQRGGEAALARLGEAVSERKGDDSPVTLADHAVQSLLLDELARRHPDHGVIVEETLENPDRHAPRESARFCWTIDPIDGTRNFSRGFPMVATSVGLLDEGVPVAGAIYDLSTRRVFSAGRGGGAWEGRRSLSVRNQPVSSDSTLALSSFRLAPMTPAVRRLVESVLFRNVGSACLQLAWTAAGYIDAIYAVECKLWDIAAGVLLILEAGGVVTDDRGGPLWPFDWRNYAGTNVPLVAGGADLHRHVVGMLAAG